jgi:hypothetical protein
MPKYILAKPSVSGDALYIVRHLEYPQEHTFPASAAMAQRDKARKKDPAVLLFLEIHKPSKMSVPETYNDPNTEQ